MFNLSLPPYKSLWSLFKITGLFLGFLGIAASCHAQVAYLSVESGIITVEAKLNNKYNAAFILDLNRCDSVIDPSLLTSASAARDFIDLAGKNLGVFKTLKTGIVKGSIDDKGAVVIGYLGRDVLKGQTVKLDFVNGEMKISNLPITIQSSSAQVSEQFTEHLSWSKDGKATVGGGQLGSVATTIVLSWIDRGWYGTVLSTTQLTNKVKVTPTLAAQGSLQLGSYRLAPKPMKLSIGTSQIIHAPIVDLDANSVEFNLSQNVISFQFPSQSREFADWIGLATPFEVDPQLDSSGKMQLTASLDSLGDSGLPDALKRMLHSNPIVAVGGHSVDHLWKWWNGTDQAGQIKLCQFAGQYIDQVGVHGIRFPMSVQTPYGLEEFNLFYTAKS